MWSGLWDQNHDGHGPLTSLPSELTTARRVHFRRTSKERSRSKIQEERAKAWERMETEKMKAKAIALQGANNLIRWLEVVRRRRRPSSRKTRCRRTYRSEAQARSGSVRQPASKASEERRDSLGQPPHGKHRSAKPQSKGTAYRRIVSRQSAASSEEELQQGPHCSGRGPKRPFGAQTGLRPWSVTQGASPTQGCSNAVGRVYVRA